MRECVLFAGYVLREDGQIRSRFGRLIKQQFCREGYLRVELWERGVGRKYLLHRLLAEAFVPNPDGKPQVNHIDGDKLNNALDNLEWVTQSENQLHAYRIGLQRGYRKPVPLTAAHKAALCGSRWRGSRRVYIADGCEFYSPEEAAAHFGVHRQTVYNRAASPNFPGWEIKVWREEKQCQRTDRP